MKKNINKIMLITFVSLIFIALTCFISTKVYENNLNDLFTTSKRFIDTDSFKAVFGTFGLISGIYMLLFYYSTLVFVPVLIILIALVLQIIARLFQIGQPKEWKDITTKVLAWLSIIPFIVLCIYIISLIVDIKIYMHIIPIIVSIATIFIISNNLITNK